MKHELIETTEGGGCPVLPVTRGRREAKRASEDGVRPWNAGVEVEPWAEPVDGAELLNALATWIRRYVVLEQAAVDTLALWVLHTHGFELRDVTVYIGVESPQKRCGKTTLLTVLSEVVNRPIVAANISSPAFFRVIEEMQPTLMIDEADTALHRNDELRGFSIRVINGRRRMWCGWQWKRRSGTGLGTGKRAGRTGRTRGHAGAGWCGIRVGVRKRSRRSNICRRRCRIGAS